MVVKAAARSSVITRETSDDVDVHHSVINNDSKCLVLHSHHLSSSTAVPLRALLSQYKQFG